MLPIDHLPFPAANTDVLAAAFERLGFQVSPPCVYSSPEGGRWRNRCVFFGAGWFDLVEAADAPPDTAPFACLFLTDDLETATAALGEVKTSEVLSLERRFSETARVEAFRYRNLHARVAPLFVSVIEHRWPCADLDPAWRTHPNGAVAINGLVFGGADPGPRAQACGRVLDLTGFGYLPAAAFAERYGAPRQPIAVQLAVRSLVQTADALRQRGADFEAGETLIARAPTGFGCSFEFVETIAA